MIKLLSATPGSGKSLWATDTLLTVCRENLANLKYNYFYAKAFFEKLEQLILNKEGISKNEFVPFTIQELIKRIRNVKEGH